MVYSLIILPLAENQIEEAIEWYESKQSGLGIAFFAYLDSYFLALQNGKAQFQIRKKPSFRELPLNKFPFVIVYETIQNKIVIYSVFNTHQNPEKKLK